MKDGERGEPKKAEVKKLVPSLRVCPDCEISKARVKQLEEAITLFPGMEALMKENASFKATIRGLVEAMERARVHFKELGFECPEYLEKVLDARIEKATKEGRG